MGKSIKTRGLLGRWRQRRTPFQQGDTIPENVTFSAEIPAGRHGSLCRVDLQWVREPQQDGERVHLRAHLQTNFASVLRPALRQQPGVTPDASNLRALALPRRAAQEAGRLTARGLQRLLSTPLAQRLTEPLLRHDFNTWVQIQASTEPLDQGALSLVPERDKLAALGIEPRRGRGPVAESWQGRTATGHAQLSVLQIDKSDLPPELADKLGKQPFQLAAAIVNTVERR